MSTQLSDVDWNGYFRCPICAGIVAVNFPNIPGAKWHGFLSGDGHFFDLEKATQVSINELFTDDMKESA